jgi:hypothetical protein
MSLVYMKKLAGIWYSLVVVVLLVCALTGILDQSLYEGGWNKASLYTKIGIPTVFITFIVFWILMLEDFLENEDVKHTVLVGSCLFFFHWIAILVYFWLVVYRRKSI